MLSRTGLYALIVLIFGVFVITMVGGQVLKKPLTGGDDVITCLSRTEIYINNQNWQKAKISVRILEKSWGKVKPRLYLGAEKDDIKRFDTALATLKASINVQDRNSALRDVGLLKQIYQMLE